MSIRVLVTGANRGIGYHTIDRLLHQAGADAGKYHFLLAARNTQQGEEAAQKLRTSYPGAMIQVVQLEVNKTESIEALVNQLKTEGALDILVNNAGILIEHTDQPFTEENVRKVLDLNYYKIKHLIKSLTENDLINENGRIINVGSEFGRFGELAKANPEVYERLGSYLTNDLTLEELDTFVQRFEQDMKDEAKRATWDVPNYTVYGRSKTFLAIYSYLLGKLPYIMQRKIQVYCACPGWCQTDMGGQNAYLTASEGGDRIAFAVNFRPAYDPEVQGRFVAVRIVKSLIGYFGCD